MFNCSRRSNILHRRVAVKAERNVVGRIASQARDRFASCGYLELAQTRIHLPAVDPVHGRIS